MPTYGTLQSDPSEVNFHTQPLAWWRCRTKLEQILFVTGFIVVVSFLVITVGLVGDDQGHMKKLAVCTETEKKPFTRILVSQNLDQQKFIARKLSESIDKNLIRQHLKELTKNYHVAGTEANLKLMDRIAEIWRSYGLDKVETEEYTVLLSYPNYSMPNTLHVLRGGKLEMLSNGTGTPLGPKEALDEQMRQPGASLWWNAYAKPGTVNATIVYANGCESSDFETLKNFTGQKKLDFRGAIVICRYGWSWRGAKVFQAEKANAGGVILYMDPKEFGPPSGSTGSFPFSNYAPPTGAQRGTVLNTIEGDPETPQIPSKPYAYRFYNEEELRRQLVLPNIPVMPMGYGDVSKIFQAMENGTPAPENFKGGLNVTYFFNTSTVFQLDVHAITQRKLIRNVFGYIFGDEEPDKLILLSNHVDAWTYGSQDPNSGTAINLALSQAYMSVINSTGWRPRRTLQFCAWDAEEFGLIGSAEWVEQKLSIIQDRVVALVNVDTALQSNVTLSVKSIPLLYRAILNATKFVQSPNPEETARSRFTVYDTWLHYRNRSMIDGQPDVPHMTIPAGGSDFKPFLQYAGIPVLDLSYQQAEYSGYPLYHTIHEVDWTVENLVDRDFETFLALGRVWAETTRNLADSLVIPFNVTDYGLALTTYARDLVQVMRKVPEIQDFVENFDLVCSNLTDASQRFLTISQRFQKIVDSVQTGSSISLGLLQRLNDRLLSLERAFLTPGGLPGRPGQRHVLFAASESNAYGSTLVAGVTDSLQRLRQNSTDPLLRKTLNNQLTVLQYATESAIDTLKIYGKNEIDLS